MKKFLNYYTAALFLSLAVLVACGGTDPEPEPTPDEVHITFITQGKSSISGVTLDNNTPVLPTGETWDDFKLTFSGTATAGGSIAAEGVPASYSVVWPASSTWSLPDANNPTVLLRSDGVTMTVKEASATSMTVAFTIAQGAGRSLVIEGNWLFTMTFSN